MMHYFDVEIAKIYGERCAVILQHIRHWVDYNKTNRKNFHDGYYWTYNSVNAFAEQFPYMTPRQISITLKKLEESGLIKTGNYNENTYDRTLWYTITEKGFALLDKETVENEPAQDETNNAEMSNACCKNVKSISPKCKMDNAKMSNPFCENVSPIPDNKPDNKPDIKADAEDRATAAVEDDEECERFCAAYNQICKELPQVLRITSTRMENIKIAIGELEELGISSREYFSRIERANFLKGKKWINFDWLIEPEHMLKLVEGAYDVVGGVTLPTESSLCNAIHMEQCNQTVELDTKNLSALTERMRKRAAEKKAGSLAG